MSEQSTGNVSEKNAAIKRQILRLCSAGKDYSLSELTKELGLSIPTVSRLVSELVDEGSLMDLGKQNTAGGRKPSIFGLNPSASYFIGVDVGRSTIRIAITNFKGKVTNSYDVIPFTLVNTEASVKEMCDIIKGRLDKAKINRRKIAGCGVSLTGRVNRESGYSFSYFISEDRTISDVLSENLGCLVIIENDSRAMAYAEFSSNDECKVGNMLFMNVSWGLGMGMIVDGKMVYGKSGYSGEIGHFPMLHNNQICRCGKTGCLETGASGSALQRIVCEELAAGRKSVLTVKYNSGAEIQLEDILEAINKEDVLAIECIEKIGYTLGTALAGLINLFNPQLVVIGGYLVPANDYLMLPVKSAVNKFSLNIVSKDTRLIFSKYGKNGAALGAAMLARDRALGII